nr:MAG TPA: hypothetical protein [Caudoviricetes sp.]
MGNRMIYSVARRALRHPEISYDGLNRSRP